MIVELLKDYNKIQTNADTFGPSLFKVSSNDSVLAPNSLDTEDMGVLPILGTLFHITLELTVNWVNRLAPLLQCWIQLKNQRLHRNFGIVNFIQKVIQIWGVKLSTQISQLENFYPEVLSKNFLSKIYVTCSTLL